MELIEPIEWIKVDKLSDDIYAIGPNIILKFNVSLSKFSGGKRYHFHKEYEYPSKEGDNLVTIKRSFDYFLSIENQQKNSEGEKMFIRIGPQDFLRFKSGLEEAISWFNDAKYSNLFAYNNGKLIILPPIPETIISGLPMNKAIHITPCIVDKGIANADKEPGVELDFGTDSINIDLDRLMGLYYIISNLNMYQAALSLVNYLGRPEFGTNRFVMETQRTFKDYDNPPKTGTTGIKGRKVKEDIDSLGG